MGVWFERGDMVFEVERDSPEHRNLVASGAEPIVDPTAEKPARKSRSKKDDSDGATLDE